MTDRQQALADLDALYADALASPATGPATTTRFDRLRALIEACDPAETERLDPLAAEKTENEWLLARNRDLERELAEAREALRRIEDAADSPSWDDPVVGVGQIARAALSASEQPARLEKLAEAQEALRRVLEWPVPQGTVGTYVLPGWLARKARALSASDQPGSNDGD
jgi:hypothetical protein